jgi:hypothetical protein
MAALYYAQGKYAEAETARAPNPLENFPNEERRPPQVRDFTLLISASVSGVAVKPGEDREGEPDDILRLLSPKTAVQPRLKQVHAALDAVVTKAHQA